jgi:glycosyltransferase involved in cell wall biosynthesis
VQNDYTVTIGVATYNASIFILEALESIYNQTYANLHLIVSDDCSKDDTVALVQKWCSQQQVQNRFLTIEIITVPSNTGVSGNCNRIIKAAKSDWIKFHAGDDILLPNCIADNVAFAKSNPQAKVLFSQVKVYQDTFEEKNYLKTTPAAFPNNLFQSNFTARDQFKLLCISDRIHFTPSYMFHKEALSQVGNYDETNRLVEDYPMWLKLTKAGIQLNYFHKPTVGYRIHAKATNNTGADVLFKPSVINGFQVRQKWAHAELPFEIVASEYLTYYFSVLFQKIGWNKKKSLYKGLYQLSTVYLNPFQYIYALKKRVPANRTNPFYS